MGKTKIVGGCWRPFFQRVVSVFTCLPRLSYASQGPLFIDCAKRAGRSIETIDSCRPAIERAGFVNAEEELFKVPVGSWPKKERLKEAGRINYHAWLEGLEVRDYE